jgi:hypothetical protein
MPRDETAPEDSGTQDYNGDYDGEDGDEDEDEEATVAPDTTTTSSTKMCEWKNCDKMFTGLNAPTLLHVRPVFTSMRLLPPTLTNALKQETPKTTTPSVTGQAAHTLARSVATSCLTS